MENISFEEQVRRISKNKHDVQTKLYGIVVNPLEQMSNGASQFYHEQMGEKHEMFRSKGTDIWDYFSEPWSDINGSAESQLLSMTSHVNHVVNVIIPTIKEIGTYYDECIKNDIFFNLNTEEGRTANLRMRQAKDSIPKVLYSLSTLSDNQTASSTHIKFCLLEELQSVFDPLKLNVNYEDEHIWYNKFFDFDKTGFVNHVLNNIATNIERHAFTVEPYDKLKIWDKKVVIKYSEDSGRPLLTIFNNGRPFEGDIERIFDYGYCHGSTKNSGFGMDSIKTFMQSIGGDVSFSTSQKGVKYSLTFKKD